MKSKELNRYPKHYSCTSGLSVHSESDAYCKARLIFLSSKNFTHYLEFSWLQARTKPSDVPEERGGVREKPRGLQILIFLTLWVKADCSSVFCFASIKTLAAFSRAFWDSRCLDTQAKDTIICIRIYYHFSSNWNLIMIRCFVSIKKILFPWAGVLKKAGISLQTAQMENLVTQLTLLPQSSPLRDPNAKLYSGTTWMVQQ